MSNLNPTPMPTPATSRLRARKALPILAAVLAAGTVVAVATSSFGQGAGPGAGPGPGFARGMGPGFGDGGSDFGYGPGWRHGGGFGFWRGAGQIDPAVAEARVDRMVRHVAVEIGANGEQQDKLSAIAKALVKDLLPVREKMIAARQQARDLLTAQTIDRGALEKMRADQIAAHDAASKRLVQGLSDAAEVLTPDQRTKLNNLLASRRGWGFGRGGWGHHMGWGGGRGMMGGWR